MLLLDTEWTGDLVLDEDLLIPVGVTLRIKAGTSVTVLPAESSRTEPEFLSPLAEITVRGDLVIEGTEALPVLLRGKDEGAPGARAWAGILVDGGKVRARAFTISGADTGITLLRGELVASDATWTRNRVGMAILDPTARVALRSALVSANDYGVIQVEGAGVDLGAARVHGNRKQDRHSYRLQQAPSAGQAMVAPADQPVTRVVADMPLVGETVWSGRVVVEGVVRVPPGSRLVILPGTLVEFTRRDTNKDGIGENGLSLQGVLIAKGSREAPIHFRSAAKTRRPGDWDAVNIFNSDGRENLVEHCSFEDAYRGLHFHFSNVVVQDSRFKGNYRAMQFQESNVAIRRSEITGNRSGIQGRDSSLELADNRITANGTGMNVLRVALTATGNTFEANRMRALRVREGSVSLIGNQVFGNRSGVSLKGVDRGALRENVIAANGETGLSVRGSDNLRVSGNFLSGNGWSGLDLRDVRLVVEGNHISYNGERGLGVRGFQGRVSSNSFVANGSWAIDLEDRGDLAAVGNWWGGERPELVVCDREDDPARGRVDVGKALTVAPPFRWPLGQVAGETRWQGHIVLGASLVVPLGATLIVRPGTVVELAPGVGVEVRGDIVAGARSGERVVFTSRSKASTGKWGEIQLERSQGSAFTRCVFEYADWGIHAHFSDLTVSECVFRHNKGGMRFRSGPVRLRSSDFVENDIGIRAFRGRAEITGNLITRNRNGVFVREKGGGLTIRGNDIYDNTSYNVRLGDFNDEDVDARGNWWGLGDPRDGIFDERSEPGIGAVRIDGALSTSVRGGADD